MQVELTPNENILSMILKVPSGQSQGQMEMSLTLRGCGVVVRTLVVQGPRLVKQNPNMHNLVRVSSVPNEPYQAQTTTVPSMHSHAKEANFLVLQNLVPTSVVPGELHQTQIAANLCRGNSSMALKGLHLQSLRLTSSNQHARVNATRMESLGGQGPKLVSQALAKYDYE